MADKRKKRRRALASSVDELVEQAKDRHQRAFFGREPEGLAEARALYEQALRAAPEHPGALHFLGILLHQTGAWERALELIARAIAARPNDADMHNNLGNILKEQASPLAAAEAYRRAIELGQRGADAESNLGVVLGNAGNAEEALAAFERALAIDPQHANAHHNLGNALVRARRVEEAIAHFEAALAAAPHLSAARQALALALHNVGRIEEAIGALRAWGDRDPDDATAHHLLAAFSQANIPNRASDAFVRHSFDLLASTFDQHLRDLGYRAPELTLAALAAIVPNPMAAFDVLDAGCGTGLCGPLLKPYAQTLVGVDLSRGMLSKAQAVGSYDQLVEAEMTAFLRSHAASYDLILSADTFCYFGDLLELIGLSRVALRSGGLLVFTVERSSAAAGFQLHAHGRYSHSEAYVREAIESAGLRLASIEHAALRQECGAPVYGLVVAAVLSEELI